MIDAEKTVSRCQSLMVEYLVPDGIGKDEFISKIILELDPPDLTERGLCDLNQTQPSENVGGWQPIDKKS